MRCEGVGFRYGEEAPWVFRGVEWELRRGKKVAVCGSTENRHGIVLTASYPAKRSGVKTGMANWEARQACPDLIQVPPHYDLYLKYSKLVRAIYARYANDIEPFGMDECWLRIEGCGDVDGAGRDVAEEIRKAVRDEIVKGRGSQFDPRFADVMLKLIDEDKEYKLREKRQ